MIGGLRKIIKALSVTLPPLARGAGSSSVCVCGRRENATTVTYLRDAMATTFPHTRHHPMCLCVYECVWRTLGRLLFFFLLLLLLGGCSSSSGKWWHFSPSFASGCLAPNGASVAKWAKGRWGNINIVSWKSDTWMDRTGNWWIIVYRRGVSFLPLSVIIAQRLRFYRSNVETNYNFIDIRMHRPLGSSLLLFICSFISKG